MKKKVTLTLLAGFVALIFGLILCGIGYFMGGIEDLKTIATPHLTEETYQGIREIKMDAQARAVLIDESPDDKFHVRYANFDNFRYRSLVVQQDNHTLTIKGKDPKFHTQGIMQFLGQELAVNMQDNHELKALTILVPKGTVLENVSGLSGWNYGDSLSLNSVHIKNLDWSGYIDGDRVKLEGGKLTALNSNSISIRNSHLKNMTVESPSASQFYHTSTLENVTIKQASSLNLLNTSILGTTSLETTNLYHSEINVELSDKSKKDTQLEATATYDWEKLSDTYYPNYSNDSETDGEERKKEFQKEQLEQMGIRLGSGYKDLTVDETTDGAKLIHRPTDAPNKLIIKTINGKISLGTSMD